MARIFSIHFLHEGSTQTGMVTVRKTPFFIEYTISMLDEEVVRLLPGTKILSYSSNHFVFANVTPDNSSDLMQIIINAISQHTHTLV